MKTSPLRKLALVALPLLLAGCVVAPAGYPYREPAVVAVAPPPPRVEIVGPPPVVGQVWIGGYWNWAGNRHEWVPGRWEAPRPGYRWVPHRWEGSGNRWQQHGGHWEQHGERHEREREERWERR